MQSISRNTGWRLSWLSIASVVAYGFSLALVPLACTSSPALHPVDNIGDPNHGKTGDAGTPDANVSHDSSVNDGMPEAESPYDAAHHAIPKQPFLGLVQQVAGPGLYGVYVADVTGDGIADVLGTHGPLGGLVIFAQQADHTLAAPVVVTQDTSLWAVVADVDADGHNDVVTAGDTAVLLYPGFGTAFARPVITLAAVPSSSQAGPIRAGDFDGDGHMDLAFRILRGSTDSSQLVVLHGDGTGAFADPFAVDLPPNSLGDVRVGNLDGDSADEIAVTVIVSSGYQVAVVDEATPRVPAVSATLAAGVDGGLSGGLFVGDLGSDGNGDVMLAEWSFVASSQVTIWTSNEAGTFAAGRAWATWERPSQVVLADMDLDGHQDLLVQHDGWFALGVGFVHNGQLADEVLAPFADIRPAFSDSLAAGDINGDGKPDLVGSSPYGLLVARHEP